MATLTIRNLDETVKRRLQVRAALNGRSMEAEARVALSEFAARGPIAGLSEISAEAATPEEGLGTAIHDLFAPLGGIDFEIPQHRNSHRPIPTFE